MHLHQCLLLLGSLTLAACEGPRGLGDELGHAVPPAGKPTAYSLPSQATQDTLVEAALSHHPTLQATRARIVALEQSAVQARYLPDPSASVSAGQMAETAAGETIAGVGVQQKIPFPGKRAEESLARMRLADAMRAQLKADELALAERIRTNHADYYLAQRTIAVVSESKEALKTLRESVESRLAANTARQQDLLRLDNEITRLDQRLNTARGRRDAAKAGLNALLYRPSGTALPAPHPPRVRSHGSASTLLARAQRKHPEVLAGEARIAAARHGVQLARLKKRPDFVAGLNYLAVSEDGLAPSSTGEDQLFGTLGITLPLWKGKNLAAEREAAANLSSEQSALAGVRASLQQRVESAVAKHDAERANLRLYSDQLIPDARQSFDLILTGYSTDQSSFLDVVDAWRQLLDYQLAEAESRSRLAKAEAALRFSAGLP